MAGGVFYREFTKYNGFTRMTALGKVHTHLFLPGMLVFLVVALYARQSGLGKNKTFRVFLWTYNIGVPLTAVMLLVRGVTQVLGLSLSSAPPPRSPVSPESGTFSPEWASSRCWCPSKSLPKTDRILAYANRPDSEK